MGSVQHASAALVREVRPPRLGGFVRRALGVAGYCCLWVSQVAKTSFRSRADYGDYTGQPFDSHEWEQGTGV